MKKPQSLNFLGPEKGFEDFDSIIPEKTHKFPKTTQASQTFFRIKNQATPSMKTSTHFRTNTLNSNRDLHKIENLDDAKRDIFGKNSKNS